MVQNDGEYISDQSPILHSTMTKLMNSEEITFRKHVLDIKDFTEIINDFDGIFQCKLALLDKSFCSINANGDSFAIISRSLSKCFDIFEIADCVRKELPH